MKALYIKFGLLLILLAFANYILFAVLGCISCLFGATDNYFCSTYCCLMKGIAASTFLLWLGWFSYSIYQFKKQLKY